LASSLKIGLAEFQGFKSSRRSILEFQFEDQQFLLAVAHLRSKLWSEQNDQLHEAMVFAKDIRICEDAKNHSRTIVIGDLNMSPFELGVVSATGLYALTTKECARTESRWVQGDEYRLFYNPMWQFFGDATQGPPGTYYYAAGGHTFAVNWHIFDQVLLRSQVFPWWRNDVTIITKAKGISLANSKGRPDPEISSDHFPILFRLHSPERD
jgi:exonuclease III